MLGSIVDTLIGLFLVYAVLGLANTTLVEGLSQWLKGLKNRGDMTAKLVGRLLGGVATQFANHPVVKGLRPDDGGWPSRISPESFKSGLFGVLNGTAGTAAVATLDDVAAAVNTLGDEDLKRTLQAFITRARAGVTDTQEQFKRFEALLDAWYCDALDRASGWYKRQARVIGLLVAAFFCLALDVDTLHIVKRLSDDPALRAKTVEAAVKAGGAPGQGGGERTLGQLVGETPECAALRAQAAPADLKLLSECDKALAAASRTYLTRELPLGWSAERKSELFALKGSFLLTWVLGIMISIIAVSMGGEFWFKAMESVIRLAGPGARSPPK